MCGCSFRIRTFRFLTFLLIIMTLNQIQQQIYTENKKKYKISKNRIGFLLFTVCLTLSLLNLFGDVYTVIARWAEPYFTPFMPQTTYYLLFNMVLYVSAIALPFVIAVFGCKTGLKGIFPLRPRLTKNPVGYTFFVFGICLLLNLVLQLLFPWYREVFSSESYHYESSTDIILYFIMSAILPAIFEEFAFRGVCISALRPMGTKFAVITSAVLFGLCHVDPLQSVFAFLFGLLIGGAYVATGSIWPGVLLHLFNNSFAVFAEYGNEVILVMCGYFIIGSIIYSLVYLFKYIRLPGRFPICVKDEKQPLLMGSGFSPLRAVFSNFWTYALIVIYILSFLARYISVLFPHLAL